MLPGIPIYIISLCFYAYVLYVFIKKSFKGLITYKYYSDSKCIYFYIIQIKNDNSIFESWYL